MNIDYKQKKLEIEQTWDNLAVEAEEFKEEQVLMSQKLDSETKEIV